MGIENWGLGTGDWAKSPIPNPQSPIPNPQSPMCVKIDFFINKICSILINNLSVVKKFKENEKKFSIKKHFYK